MDQEPEYFQELDRLYGIKPKKPLPQKESEPEYFAELDKLYGVKSKEPENQEFTAKERMYQIPYGMAQAYSGIANLLSPFLSQEITQGRTPSGFGASFNYERPDIQEMLDKKAQSQEKKPFPKVELEKEIEKLAGRSLEPTKEDTVGKVLTGTGQFLAPMPPALGGSGVLKAGALATKAVPKLGSEAGKNLLKEAGKEAAKEVGMATGASTAIHATPKFLDEGTPAGAVEDLLKAVVGGAAGIKSTSIAKDLTLDLSKLPQKGISKLMTPDPQVLQYAKKHGIDLPANIGSNSKILNWISNDWLKKSMFSSQVFKKSFEKADEQMVARINKAIDTIEAPDVKPNAASTEYRHYMLNQEKNASKAYDELVGKAEASLKSYDDVIPSNTVASINKIQDIIGKDVIAPQSKKVYQIVTDLGQRWGILPKDAVAEQLINDPMHLIAYLESFKQNPNAIPVKRMVDTRKELNRIIYEDPEAKGISKLLSGLSSSITKDIESTSNKEFLKNWKSANNFYKENIADVFRTDLAHSMMTGEKPKLAYDLMKTPEDVIALEKIANQNPNGKIVMDQLKRAKVREILNSATVGGLEKGSISLAKFRDLFSKGEKRQEMLSHLLGKKEYNNLAEISEISREFSKSGRDLLNTSGTAIQAANLNQMQSVVNSALQLLVGGATGELTGGHGAALALTGGNFLATNLLSRILANPRYIERARSYALARQKGNDKYAQTILKPFVNQLIKEANDLKED